MMTVTTTATATMMNTMMMATMAPPCNPPLAPVPSLGSVVAAERRKCITHMSHSLARVSPGGFVKIAIFLCMVMLDLAKVRSKLRNQISQVGSHVLKSSKFW